MCSVADACSHLVRHPGQNCDIYIPTGMPHPPRMMPITNTTQCEALGGSCAVQADCDVASNMFNGSCDDADMGCCISKDVICAAMKGECLSAADCEAKPDCHATPLECGDGVCCAPKRPPPQQRFGGKDYGNQRGGNKHGRNGLAGQNNDLRELKHTITIYLPTILINV